MIKQAGGIVEWVDNEKQTLFVRVDNGVAIKAARIAVIEANITKGVNEYKELEQLVFEKSFELRIATSDLNDALRAFNQNQSLIAELDDEVKRLQSELAVLTQQKNAKQLEIKSLRLKRDIYSNVNVENYYNVFCMHYKDLETEIQSGDQIALVAINNETGHICTTAESVEGEIEWAKWVPYILQDSKAAYYNAAILAGVQKDRPIYRKGTITNIDAANNRADVLPDQAFSSAQSLFVNDDNIDWTQIPVEYPVCGAGAFQDGDKVVVELIENDWANAKVIGFAENPRPCPEFWAAVEIQAVYSFFALADPTPIPAEDKRLCYTVFVAATFDNPKRFTAAEYEAGLTLEEITEAEYSPPTNTQTNIVIYSNTLYNNPPLIPPASFTVDSVHTLTKNVASTQTTLKIDGAVDLYNSQRMGTSNNYEATTVFSSGSFAKDYLTTQISDYIDENGITYKPTEFGEFFTATPTATFTYLNGQPAQSGSAVVIPVGIMLVKYNAGQA